MTVKKSSVFSLLLIIISRQGVEPTPRGWLRITKPMSINSSLIPLAAVKISEFLAKVYIFTVFTKWGL